MSDERNTATYRLDLDALGWASSGDAAVACAVAAEGLVFIQMVARKLEADGLISPEVADIFAVKAAVSVQHTNHVLRSANRQQPGRRKVRKAQPENAHEW
jgi:hypothetical protein